MFPVVKFGLPVKIVEPHQLVYKQIKQQVTNSQKHVKYFYDEIGIGNIYQRIIIVTESFVFLFFDVTKTTKFTLNLL